MHELLEIYRYPGIQITSNRLDSHGHGTQAAGELAIRICDG